MPLLREYSEDDINELVKEGEGGVEDQTEKQRREGKKGSEHSSRKRKHFTSP